MKDTFLIQEQLSWRWWVTPKPLLNKPIHRWYIFPHSFSNELVHVLIEEWSLGPKDHILDPFSGAGTTILAAKEKGVPASGYDLSPLAALATRTKISNFNIDRLKNAWTSVKELVNRPQNNGTTKSYPQLVKKALPGRLLRGFDEISRSIESISCSESERDFFRLALLAILPDYSRAVATGGWLKWVKKRVSVESLPSEFSKCVETMIDDLYKTKLPRRSWWQVEQVDARQLPDDDETYSAIITSPPYPNRHDYTRVFGVELMFSFLNWEETRQLRYQSFHSHPEARPKRPEINQYAPPKSLTRKIARIKKIGRDSRIPPMLEGYFLDMYHCLREMKRVCRPQAKVALVLGNAQYCGESISVDKITAEIGEQIGLTCEKIIIARYRGNSAQQMGKYGRNPSRESVVIFRK